MPDDVRVVQDENGEARVPARRSTVLELVFLLKLDMVQQACVSTAPHQATNGRAGWTRSLRERCARTVTVIP